MGLHYDLLGRTNVNLAPSQRPEANNLALMPSSELAYYARAQRSEGQMENMRTILFPFWQRDKNIGKLKREKRNDALNDELNDLYGDHWMGIIPELTTG